MLRRAPPPGLPSIPLIVGADEQMPVEPPRDLRRNDNWRRLSNFGHTAVVEPQDDRSPDVDKTTPRSRCRNVVHPPTEETP
jgi:hypothetical protein